MATPGQDRGDHERVAEARRLADEARAADTQGLTARASELFDAAIALLDHGPRPPLLADVLRWKGTALRERGNTHGAEQLYERSVELAAAGGQTLSHAHGLNCLGIIAQRRGDLERAAIRYEEAAALASTAVDAQLLGMIEQNRGVLASIRGDRNVALLRYTSSLAAFEAAGNDEAVSWVLNNLGMLHSAEGRHVEAERTFERAMEIASRREDRRMSGLIQINWAEAYLVQDKLEDAEARAAIALAHAVHRGDTLQSAEALKVQGRIDRRRKDYDGAWATLGRARELADQADDALLGAEIMRELAEMAEEQGQVDRARAAWRGALASFQSLGADSDARQIANHLRLLR